MKDDDLVIATHGRALWILDDLTPLRQLKDGVPASSDFLFSPRPTRRIALPQSFPYHPGQGKNYRMVGGEIVPFYEGRSPNGNVRHTYLTAGENPPRGVSVTYVMNDKPRGEVKLTFLDSLGHVIKQFSSRTDQGQRAPVQPGMNCFIWDMRYPDAEGITSMEGPIAPPGDYQVQLSVGDAIYTQTFQIFKDSRVTASQEDLQAQFNLLINIRDAIQETNKAVAQIRETRGRIEGWERIASNHQSSAEFSSTASRIKQELSSIEEQLVPILGPNPQKPPPTRLGPKLASLSEVIASGDFPPTTQACQVFQKLTAEVHERLDRLDQILGDDIPTLEKSH